MADDPKQLPLIRRRIRGKTKAHRIHDEVIKRILEENKAKKAGEKVTAAPMHMNVPKGAQVGDVEQAVQSSDFQNLSDLLARRRKRRQEEEEEDD